MGDSYGGCHSHPSWRREDKEVRLEDGAGAGNEEREAGKLCVVTKSNAQSHGLVLWDGVAAIVSRETGEKTY